MYNLVAIANAIMSVGLLGIDLSGKLPEGFQRAEFLLAHGTVDMIIHRHDLSGKLGGLLRKMTQQPTAC